LVNVVDEDKLITAVWKKNRWCITRATGFMFSQTWWRPPRS